MRVCEREREREFLLITNSSSISSAKVQCSDEQSHDLVMEHVDAAVECVNVPGCCVFAEHSICACLSY